MRFLMDMNRTTKKKAKKADKEQKKVEPEPLAPTPATEEDKPFDFGGLPNRDLKKNLGCG
jgi:hypothetical protein